MLVMEYADGGSLRNYLKKNFSKLTWDDKLNMAYQLAYAISCLHDEGIILVFIYYKIIVSNSTLTFIHYIYFFNSTLTIY
jgi:serine/threonine protein kinase